MSRLHVMQSAGVNTYQVFVHTPTPAGNNAAGVAWSACLVNSGSNVSSMPVGSGGGRISNAENNAIIAGSTFETNFIWEDPRPDGGAGSAAARAADLNIRAEQAVAGALEEFQKRMRFFGHEVA
jgi:hypothetical protein